LKKGFFSILLIMLLITNDMFLAFKVSAEENQNSPSEISKDLSNIIKQKNVAESTAFNNKEAIGNESPQIEDEKLCSINTTRKPWEQPANETNQWQKMAFGGKNTTRIVIRLKTYDSKIIEEIKILAEKCGGRIVNNVSIRNEVIALVVEIPTKYAPFFTEQARGRKYISYIQPSMKFKVTFTPNDPYWNQQWAPKKIEANWAWNTTLGDPSVLVAVIDTGIYYLHEDLIDNYVPLGYDWVNDDTDPMDDHGHGTHVAGIIAATIDNNVGIAGLAQVKIMAEKALDEWGWGYDDWVANAIIHATDQGADIISMSLGGYGHSELIYEAVRYAYSNNVLLVAAAGNDGTDMPFYPAAYEEVIAVTATDSNDQRPWWSNYGEYDVEIAAPGVDILSTVPWGYATKSGTSMATPHVSGVAALVLSVNPNATTYRVRYWLRLTADDLGDSGYDIYYGYGRVNARKAVENPLPEHEILVSEWKYPPYVEPGATAKINVTVYNFGTEDESNITLKLIVNATTVDVQTISLLQSDTYKTISLYWTPSVEGLYNVTCHLLPVQNETIIENNVASVFLYVGFPIKAVVLQSAGNIIPEIITNWQVLNREWRKFGEEMIYIDYTTLDKDDITYEDLASTEADVLIISCAYDPDAGWEFTDSEIEAISRYVKEGHGLIATAGTLYYGVPNNNKLAALFGLNQTVAWTVTGTDLLHLLNISHPIFQKVPDPFIFSYCATSIPFDGAWDSNELTDGKYLAIGHYLESAIVARRGLLYISPWFEILPAYYHHHLQLFYNIITWSTYRKPPHDIAVYLEVPLALKPEMATIINATVSNAGASNETNVELKLLIDGEVVHSLFIPQLLVESCETLNYSWTPTEEAIYNITAYAPPIPGEETTINNVESAQLIVSSGLTAILKNVDAWGQATNEDILSRHGIPYITIRSTDFGQVDLDAFSKVIIASDQDQSFYTAIEKYRSWLEQYVLEGGILEIHAADHGWNGGQWVGTLPGGLQWTSYFSDYVAVVDPTHPILHMPNRIIPEELNYWGWSVHGYFSTYPDNADIIIVGGYTGYPACLEFHYGNGLIIASSQTLEWAYMNSFSPLLENFLLYFKYPHEIAIGLEAPKWVEPETTVTINATIYNVGENNEYDVELLIFINGTPKFSTRISMLEPRQSYPVNYTWQPQAAGIYNITAYAPPVPEEKLVVNNRQTILVDVRPPIFVLFDQTHEADYLEQYNYLIQNLNMEGYAIEALTQSPLTQEKLTSYDILVIPQPREYYNSSEILAIQEFVASGGGLFLIGDDCPWIYTTLTEFAGITWDGEYYGWWGYTDNITPHPVTHDVELAFFDAPISQLMVTSPARGIIRDGAGYGEIMLAVSTYGKGKIVCIADEQSIDDYDILYADNLKLALNIMRWLYTPPRYDIQVEMDVEPYIELNTSVTINAYIYNRGLCNATNLQFYMWLNNILIVQETFPIILPGGRKTINYTWTAERRGKYNFTAYVPPLPNETRTLNNIVQKTSIVFFYVKVETDHVWCGLGNPMNWYGDDAYFEYPLPFKFPFYGNYFNKIYVSTNGLITFLEPDTSCSNSLEALASKFAIAPAWDDWVTEYPTDIYIMENSTCILIRWYVRHYGTDVIGNFEAILYRNGIIQFNYGYSNGPVSATIGISNGINHIIAMDTASINSTLTIKFIPYIHDVAIRNVVSWPDKVYVGQPVNVNVTLVNEGETPEEVEINVYFENSTQKETLTGDEANIIAQKPPPPNSIWIEPSQIDLTNYLSGDRFNITVWLNLAEPSYAWQIMLIFNSTILKATNAGYTAGATSQFFEGLPTLAVEPVFGPLNATHSYVLYGESLMGGIQRDPGMGSLCWIEFELIEKPDEPYIGHLVLEEQDTCVLNLHLEYIWLNRYGCVYTFNVPPATIPPPAPPGGVKLKINLEPGASYTVTATLNTLGMSFGNYTVEAAVTPIIGEMDLKDNIFTDGVIQVLWQHDVSILNASLSKTWVYPGWPVTINVTVSNKGDFTENVTVKLYYETVSESPAATTVIHNLDPNHTQTVSLIWETANVTPCNNYTIIVIAEIEEPDTNPENNIVTAGKVKIRMMGDVNGDEKVDIRDIAAVAASFGADCNSPKWNPDVDFNRDQKINIIDIAIVASNFRKHP